MAPAGVATFLSHYTPGPNRYLAMAIDVTRLAGYGVFIWGCCMYAMAKGRSPVWGVFGFLNILGLIPLVLLADRCPNPEPAPTQRGFEVLPLKQPHNDAD